MNHKLLWGLELDLEGRVLDDGEKRIVSFIDCVIHKYIKKYIYPTFDDVSQIIKLPPYLVHKHKHLIVDYINEHLWDRIDYKASVYLRHWRDYILETSSPKSVVLSLNIEPNPNWVQVRKEKEMTGIETDIRYFQSEDDASRFITEVESKIILDKDWDNLMYGLVTIDTVLEKVGIFHRAMYDTITETPVNPTVSVSWRISILDDRCHILRQLKQIEQPKVLEEIIRHYNNIDEAIEKFNTRKDKLTDSLLDGDAFKIIKSRIEEITKAKAENPMYKVNWVEDRIHIHGIDFLLPEGKRSSNFVSCYIARGNIVVTLRAGTASCPVSFEIPASDGDYKLYLQEIKDRAESEKKDREEYARLKDKYGDN